MARTNRSHKARIRGRGGRKPPPGVWTLLAHLLPFAVPALLVDGLFCYEVMDNYWRYGRLHASPVTLGLGLTLSVTALSVPVFWLQARRAARPRSPQRRQTPKVSIGLARESEEREMSVRRTLRPLLRPLLRLTQNAVEKPFDYLLRIDTLRLLGMDTSANRFADGTHYQPVSYLLLPRLLRPLHLNAEDVVFDIGAGAGRLVCWLARMRVRSVTGVEFVPELAQLARQNIAHLRGRSAQARILQADATTVDYAGGTVFCFYFPFGGESLRKTLDMIHRSAKADEAVRLAFIDHRPAHETVLAACPWLHCYHRSGHPIRRWDRTTYATYWTSGPVVPKA